MTEQKSTSGLDFKFLRRAIERNDPELMLDFYAEDAEVRVLSGGVTFELQGKAEIAKYLRVVYARQTTHRVGEIYLDEEQVTFQEVCEYPDGNCLFVATTLEVRGREIFRQLDVVTNDEESGEEVS